MLVKCGLLLAYISSINYFWYSSISSAYLSVSPSYTNSLSARDPDFFIFNLLLPCYVFSRNSITGLIIITDFSSTKKSCLLRILQGPNRSTKRLFSTLLPASLYVNSPYLLFYVLASVTIIGFALDGIYYVGTVFKWWIVFPSYSVLEEGY